MNTDKIRELNDAFRKSLGWGRFMLTPGVIVLLNNDDLKYRALMDAISNFDDFGADNDPYHEHDFGSLLFDGQKVFWKIDYYDNKLAYGSSDPSDPAVTTRVMTIMLASEY